MRIGYTTGVFDMFHVGHLNLLKRASALCDRLVVGVTTDALVEERKSKSPVIPFTERVEIVRAVRYVDTVVPQSSMDKLAAWESLRFHVVFVGDDWKNTPEWDRYEEQFGEVGVDVIYFPYTQSTSSTKLAVALAELTDDSA